MTFKKIDIKFNTVKYLLYLYIQKFIIPHIFT